MVWLRSDGSNFIIQIALSIDFGLTWQNPTTTPPNTTPPDNLSVSGQDAENPQLAVDGTGNRVYVLWDRSNTSANFIIQVANGFKTFFPITQMSIHKTN